jgi:hypothetical protein
MFVQVAAASVLQDMVVGSAPCCRLRRLTLSTKTKRFLFRMARMARMKSFPSFIRCRRALPVARFRMCSESQDHRNFFVPWRLLGCGRHGPVVVLCPTGSRRAACRPRLRGHSLRSRGDITPRSNATALHRGKCHIHKEGDGSCACGCCHHSGFTVSSASSQR